MTPRRELRRPWRSPDYPKLPKERLQPSAERPQLHKAHRRLTFRRRTARPQAIAAEAVGAQTVTEVRLVGRAGDVELDEFHAESSEVEL